MDAKKQALIKKLEQERDKSTSFLSDAIDFQLAINYLKTGDKAHLIDEAMYEIYYLSLYEYDFLLFLYDIS